MTEQAASLGRAEAAARAPSLPLIVILLGQMQLGFNVTALAVSIGGIVDTFDTSPTSVGTALVVYSLAVAGFVMLGAKIGNLFGSRLVFQMSAAAHGAAMALMALSTSIAMLFVAQAIAGLAAAAMIPTLVVLIATHYRGKQQAQALGLLAAGVPLAGVIAFLVAGFLGTAVGWRSSFALIAVVAVAVVVLSWRLKPVEPKTGVMIDWVGVVLVAAGIILLSVGFNGLNAWGLLLAKSDAPFSILGVSPAPILVIFGVVLTQAFFAWTLKRRAENKAPLLAPEVLESREERAATFSLLIIGALGPAVNFLIPLYIQIVQGRSSLQMAVATIPYSFAIFVAATFVVRLYDRLTPRQIGRSGFVMVAAGLALLAFVIQNDWGTPLVIVSLLVVGLGEGMLITIVFNVLVSASPKELAGDVGALRGTTNNLSTGLGTAIAGALAVGVLGLLIVRSVADHPAIPPALIEQVNLDQIDFVSNDRVQEVLQKTTATPAQVAEAVRINEDARLQALKLTFLVLAGVALLAIVPASGLPPYLHGDLPAEQGQEGGDGWQDTDSARDTGTATPARSYVTKGDHT
jgi:MFS family permease